jgi:hypothetical protein
MKTFTDIFGNIDSNKIVRRAMACGVTPADYLHFLYAKKHPKDDQIDIDFDKIGEEITEQYDRAYPPATRRDPDFNCGLWLKINRS